MTSPKLTKAQRHAALCPLIARLMKLQRVAESRSRAAHRENVADEHLDGLAVGLACALSLARRHRDRGAP